MKALGYIRRSKRSDEKAVSLLTQKEKILGYAAARGLSVVEWLEHDGISGGNRKRFAVIESHRAAHGCHHIVIYSQDRFARDASGLLDYFAHLTSQGVKVHSVLGGGPLDFRSATGKLMVGVMASFDEFYRNFVSEKTADALHQLRAQGRRYSHIPPFGWQWCDGAMVEHPEEQQALAVIDQCRRAGLGRVRTLRRLQQSGYTGRCSPALIQKCLKNPTGAQVAIDHILESDLSIPSKQAEFGPETGQEAAQVPGLRVTPPP